MHIWIGLHITSYNSDFKKMRTIYGRTKNSSSKKNQRSDDSRNISISHQKWTQAMFLTLSCLDKSNWENRLNR